MSFAEFVPDISNDTFRFADPDENSDEQFHYYLYQPSGFRADTDWHLPISFSDNFYHLFMGKNIEPKSTLRMNRQSNRANYVQCT